MIRIGLTGGIGSGKSTVARIFEVLGIPVYYADEEAKKLMATDPVLREAIISEFGQEAYSSGMLDRKYLASVVFNDPAKLAKLNALVHPATLASSEQWMMQQQTPYAIKEAALLFESGAQKQLDNVIGVNAPYALRIQRVMERDNITKEEIERRMAGQLDETKKMNLCDFIVNNDEQELLIPQVIELHRKLLSLT